ncbi:hypothetical protein Tco_0914388, partial [Tanacetum coccineum]
MSQPANDEFSQHLSDEESNHEDASDAISNIKLPILKKEEYDIWAMEMKHYLEYIDNEDGIVRVLSPVTAAEIQGASKASSSAQNVAFVSQSKSSTNKVKSGFTGAYSTCTPSTSSTNVPEKEVLAGFADEVISIPSLQNNQRTGTCFMKIWN